MKNFMLNMLATDVASNPLALCFGIIGITFIILLVGLIIYGVIGCMLVYQKAKREYDAGNYDYVLKKVSFFEKGMFRNPIQEYCFQLVALSYFNIGNDAEFFKYTDKLTDKSLFNARCYMMAVYSIVTENGEYDTWRERIENSVHEECKGDMLLRLDEIMTVLNSENYEEDLAKYLERHKNVGRLGEYLISRK